MMMMRNRLFNSFRVTVRNGSSHAHHAPAKPVDLNIPLEGVEARWSGLVEEQKDAVCQKARELMKQDWKTLSLSQKKTLYFVAFRANEYPPTEVGKVFTGIVAIIAATVGLFSLTRAFAPPPPRTMNKEWKEAENEYLKKQKINPITGISSDGYKGKGMTGSLGFS